MLKTAAPYKVIADEDQRATVIDRETGHPAGYVVLWAHGWAAYLDCEPGWQLPFGWSPVERRLTETLGWRCRPQLWTRYRRDAVARVWTAHMGGR